LVSTPGVAPVPAVVVVTGGSGGIGRAIADAFATQGASVVVLDLVSSGAHEFVAADVTAGGSVDAAFESVLEGHGRVDVLCNCAGIADGIKTATELDESMWDRVMAVNAKGVFLTTRAVLPAMVSQGGGCIINVASVAGFTGGASGVAYTASKHAVIGITKNTAAFYGEVGIRCNAVCPGGIDSGMNLLATGSPASEERIARIRQRIPRRGSPAEIASVVTFLASDAASLINGAVVVADAGWTAV